MVCDITYLITLNNLTLYFLSILKVEKVQKALRADLNIYFRDQEEYCNIPFRYQYFATDKKNKKLRNIFEQDNISCQIPILSHLVVKSWNV